MEVNIKIKDFDALYSLLWREKSVWSVRDIARFLGVSTRSASALAAALVAEGYAVWIRKSRPCRKLALLPRKRRP